MFWNVPEKRKEENLFTKNFMCTLNGECSEMFQKKRKEENMPGMVINGLLKKFEVHIRFDQELLTKVEIKSVHVARLWCLIRWGIW